MTEREHNPIPLQDLDFFSTDATKAKALKAKARNKKENRQRNRGYLLSGIIGALTPRHNDLVRERRS